MLEMKKVSLAGASLALLSVLLSCAPARTRSIRKEFIPPESSDATRVVTPAPPVLQPRVEVGDEPHFLAPARSGARVEALLKEADFYFEEGRRRYQQGDEEGARREFDRAVDLLLAGPEGSAVRSSVDSKLDQLVDAIHRLDLAGLGSADTAAALPFEKPPLEDIPQLTFPVDPKLKNKVAEELRATSSQLPLDLNDEVLSYINYFSTERGRRILVSGLRRAGRYRPLIQRILDEEGVPQELIYLAQAESGFFTRAISRKKAMGMWQFMQQRAHEYGLALTPYRDDRFDPERSTRAAARHLRDLYHRYGDWYLAMAAYNCGPGVIDRAVERTGYADFFELRRRNTMPRESSNYVPAILAMTIMVKNGREYGLENLETEPPLEYDTVELTAPTHLPLIADLTECPVPHLHELNPALLKNTAPEGTALRVPKGTGSALGSVLEAIPASHRAAWRAHHVTGGETLAAIARRYRVREDSIVAANHPGVFSPGQLLIIPTAAERERAGPRASRKHLASRKSGARRAGTSASAPSSTRPVAYSAARISPQPSKHITLKR